ncbi:protocadherin beta-11-like [Zophobas morio]|uniref:protocadherin beta-11-like n=1 Tax=Zophobas morio TaxID=2755281 RepID=UPI0030827E83
MKQKITLFILSALLARCSSQVLKCDVDDPGSFIGWDTAIIATDPINDIGGLNLEFTYRGDLQLEADTEEEGAKYIDITADGSTLSIKTNDYFKNNYEEDQKGQAPASTFVIYRTLSITCDGTTYPLNMVLYVQDTNNHAPTFTQDTYTYVIPMPLVPNIDLTNFGEVEIIAEDIDFSNTKMTFTVDPPEYFALDFKALPSRQYHAILKVTQSVTYDEGLTLTIIATDETDPFNNGTATVIIKNYNDFSQSEATEAPTFDKLYY